MDREEFYEYLIKNYNFNSHIEGSMLRNILDHAEKLPEKDQYDFLCEMLDFIAESDIRKASF